MAIKNKEGKSLSKREQAKKVREWTGWSREQYNKEYDKLRNRVRAYEKATKATRKINVSDLLARHARGKYYEKTYGLDYKESEIWKAIQAAPSISSGRELSKKTIKEVSDFEISRIEAQYYGVLNNSKFSEEIQSLLDKFRKAGKLTSRVYRLIAQRYARKLGREKEELAKTNSEIQDPFKKIFFNS